MYHYLDRMHSMWAAIADTDIEVASLDAYTVRKLELLSPAYSAFDRDELSKLEHDPAIFPGVKEKQMRDGVFCRLRRCGRILTFHSFFEDMIYVRVCYDALQTLFPRPAESRDALSFRQELRHHYEGDDDGPFLQCYQELWLYAMRHFPSLVSKKCSGLLVCPNNKCQESGEITGESARDVPARFARLAGSLGFRSEKIDEASTCAVDQDISASPYGPEQSLESAPRELCRHARCNRPCERTMSSVQKGLFLENFSGERNYHSETYPTSIALKMDLCLCLWDLVKTQHPYRMVRPQALSSAEVTTIAERPYGDCDPTREISSSHPVDCLDIDMTEQQNIEGELEQPVVVGNVTPGAQTPQVPTVAVTRASDGSSRYDADHGSDSQSLKVSNAYALRLSMLSNTTFSPFLSPEKDNGTSPNGSLSNTEIVEIYFHGNSTPDAHSEDPLYQHGIGSDVLPSSWTVDESHSGRNNSEESSKARGKEVVRAAGNAVPDRVLKCGEDAKTRRRKHYRSSAALLRTDSSKDEPATRGERGRTLYFQRQSAQRRTLREGRRRRNAARSQETTLRSTTPGLLSVESTEAGINVDETRGTIDSQTNADAIMEDIDDAHWIQSEECWHSYDVHMNLEEQDLLSTNKQPSTAFPSLEERTPSEVSDQGATPYPGQRRLLNVDDQPTDRPTLVPYNYSPRTTIVTDASRADAAAALIGEQVHYPTSENDIGRLVDVGKRMSEDVDFDHERATAQQRSEEQLYECEDERTGGPSKGTRRGSSSQSAQTIFVARPSVPSSEADRDAHIVKRDFDSSLEDKSDLIEQLVRAVARAHKEYKFHRQRVYLAAHPNHGVRVRHQEKSESIRPRDSRSTSDMTLWHWKPSERKHFEWAMKACLEDYSLWTVTSGFSDELEMTELTPEGCWNWQVHCSEPSYAILLRRNATSRARYEKIRKGTV